MVMRSRFFVAGAAVLFGVVVAHVLDGLAEISEQDHHFETAAHAQGSGFLPWMVTGLLVIAAMMLVRRLPARLNPLLVALPFLAWAVQEATERVGSGESLPFQPNSLKHIALGVLLQLPVALFIYLLVRVAIVVVRRLAGVFPQPEPDRRDTRARFGDRRGFATKISTLARGSPTRGPPVLVSI